LPVCVIAETFRAKTWEYAQFYALVSETIPVSKIVAEQAGFLLAAIHRKSGGAPHTIDALVFAEAAMVVYSHILTGDKSDLQRFADERPDFGITIVGLDDIGPAEPAPKPRSQPRR
jgi:hypothetical protein